MLQLAQKLQQARVSANLTVTEMAEKIGTKRSTYQYWEEKGPPIEKIPGIISALNLPDNYFFVTNVETEMKKSLPMGDLHITLKDHFDLLKEHAAIMKRIVEARLLEPTGSHEPQASTEEMLLKLGQQKYAGMIGDAPSVSKKDETLQSKNKVKKAKQKDR